jgi:Winged helix-turn-helix DNA-binding
MTSVNPVVMSIRLRDFLDAEDVWGSREGIAVRKKLLRAVENHPEATIIRVSLAGIRRTDTSFARESILELAHQLRGRRGVCVTDVPSQDVLDNWDAAALKRGQALVVWSAKGPQLIGPKPSDDTWELLKLVLKRGELTTAEAAKVLGKQVNNVSTRLKRLSDEGLVLRKDVNASTGGLEYRYLAIC